MGSIRKTTQLPTLLPSLTTTTTTTTITTTITTTTMLELHAFPASSPSRAVHMTLDLLGLEYTYTTVNILEGEQMVPGFLAMNPQHTVPVLCDGNLTITESRAAMAYLVSQHKPGQLYPACAKKRSQIDQRLHFGIGTFWARIADCVLPVCLGKTSTIPQEKIDALKEALMWANQTVSCGYLSLKPYKSLLTWSQTMKQQIPKYSENCGKGAAIFGEWFKGNYRAQG